MIRRVSICCTLATVVALALAVSASAQTKEIQDATTGKLQDAKLRQLEAKLQALLAEIKALRATPAQPAASAAKTEEKKPTAIKVVVDGEKVTVIDAATGKVISQGDAGHALRLWTDGKAGEKKAVVVSDNFKKVVVGDEKTERKVIVVGPDGTEIKGEKKVIIVDDAKGDGKATRVIELKDGVFRVTPSGAPAAPAKPVAPAKQAAPTPPTAPAAPAAPAAPGAPARFAVPAQPGVVGAWAAPHKAGEPASYSWSSASGASGDTVMLSRTTYAMPADKAKALESFLKEHVKTKVLETKFDGDKLVVTTTPEVQGTIGALVGIMSGKSPGAASYRFQLAQPTAPKKP